MKSASFSFSYRAMFQLAVIGYMSFYLSILGDVSCWFLKMSVTMDPYTS